MFSKMPFESVATATERKYFSFNKDFYIATSIVAPQFSVTLMDYDDY